MLLSIDHFAPVLDPLRGRRVGYVRMIGNVGDELIQAATFQLFDRAGIEYVVVNPDDWFGFRTDVDVYAIAGGGNMGGGGQDIQPPYSVNHQVRAALVARAGSRPVIVLPQTYTDSHEGLLYDHVWVRERTSQSINPAAGLAPDLSLGYELTREYPAAEQAEGVFLWQHCRWPAWTSQDIGDPALIAETVDEYFALAACCEHVVTNRLHFAIAALLLGRRATLLPGSWHKNRSVWETWLRDLGCEWIDCQW